MRTIAALLATVALAGCCEDKPPVDLGTIVSVDMKIGSWNACDKTVIKTDRTVIMICTSVKVIPLGRKIEMVLDACGQKTFRVENGPTMREPRRS